MLNPIYMFGGSPRVNLPNALKSEPALLLHLGLTNAELKKIWWHRAKMYSVFSISKGDSKQRVITAPDKRLKMLQRKIADLLSQVYKPRNTVHGFIVDRSVKTNAASHLNRGFVINLDLEDFFPTITEGRISGLFVSIGISPRVADILSHICCVAGCLPQGAPSSPVLSNMICYKMDKELQDYAKKNQCIYTRYADDLTISCHRPPSFIFEVSIPAAGRFDPKILQPEFKAIVEGNGFIFHKDKAHFSDKHSRKTVTGIRINEFPNVDRRYVRNLRAALYCVEQKGGDAAQAMLTEKYGRAAKITPHLQGKISWLGYIKGRSDPIFRGMALRFNRSFPGHEIEVHPSKTEIRDRAVWVIEHEHGEGAQGTVFFVEGVGLLTAWHCVEDADEVEIFHPSKPANKFKASVKRHCAARDLALLDHNVPINEYYELGLSNKAVESGDGVIALGYPSFGFGDRINVRAGTVSSLPVKRAVQLIEVTQKLAQGMSGGPLVDGDMSVVGVIHKGGPAEARDFAIHVSMLTAFLSEE